MNRRRTIARPTGVLHRLRSPRNRRLVAKSSTSVPTTPRDWRKLSRIAGRAAIRVLKIGLPALALVVVGLGGYHGYRRAMASTTFRIKQIDIEGSRRAPRQELLHLVQGFEGRSIFSVDLGAVSRAMKGHPWVKEVRVSRQLPSRLLVQVQEHRPEALLQLGYLYLVDAEGFVFKRSGTEETEGLPIITGIDRTDYLENPEICRARVKRVLQVLARYHDQPRPALSEVNLGARDEITLYLRQGGLAVRMGTDVSPERLHRFDAVWEALGSEVRRARVIFLDHEVRTDRVIVRMGSKD